MAIRFTKRIKIAPGLKINLSKKGISSTSLGFNGATANLSGKGIKGTAGIPGTGLSTSENLASFNKNQKTKKQGINPIVFIVFVALTVWFFSR